MTDERRSTVETDAGAPEAAETKEKAGAKKAAAEKEAERRKKEREQWARIMGEYYAENVDPTRRKHPGFDPTDDAPENKGSLTLTSTGTTTGLLKDGTWKSRIQPLGKDQEPRLIIVKNKSVTSYPTPQTLGELEEACWEMFMFMKSKGEDIVTVDFPEKDITEDRLLRVIAAAEKADQTINWGLKVRAFLKKHETNKELPFIPGFAVQTEKDPETGARKVKTKQLTDNEMMEREKAILEKTETHNQGREKRSVDERGKIQDFHYERYQNEFKRTKNVTDAADARTTVNNQIDITKTPSEQVTALENQINQLEKQLATIENARSHLKMDLEFYNRQLATANSPATIEVLTKNREITQNLLNSVDSKNKDVALRKEVVESHFDRLKDALTTEKNNAATTDERKDEIDADLEKLESLKEKYDEMETTTDVLAKDILAVKRLFQGVYKNIPRPTPPTPPTSSTISVR